jgi:4-amino-4-deoxy-L-arabinose transferase-like glycosyltransferase
MTSRAASRRSFVRTALSTLVPPMALLVFLWIAVSGLVAVARNPYLVAAYWFLGLVGLFACAGAFLEASRSQDPGGGEIRPFRCVGFLGSAALVGIVFWSQARPLLEGPAADEGTLGVVLAMLVVMGIGVFLALSVVLLTRTEDPVGEGDPVLDPRRGPGDGVPAEGLVA